MTHRELVKLVALQLGVTQKSVDDVLSNVAVTVPLVLKKGEVVSVSGLGEFAMQLRASRNAVNPRTQKMMVVPTKKVPAFKVSVVLKKRVV